MRIDDCRSWTIKNAGRRALRFSYDGEHRLSEVVRETRHGAQTHVSFRYDPLGRRISKTSRTVRKGEQPGQPRTTYFVWEGLRLLQEIQDAIPLTYVYAGQSGYEPLARIDGLAEPEIYWYHCHPNGMPERLTDEEGKLRWHGHNSAWGKLLREEKLSGPGFAQNLRMQGQYLDRETGLHYNLFRYYDPDCGRFMQQDPIGLAGGLNLYQYAPNALGWIDPLGLTKCKPNKKTTYEGKSRRDALRQAKRDAGIPMNQHPYDVSRATLGDGYGDYVRDTNGIPLQTRQYHFKDQNGSTVVIQEHSLGHAKATPLHGAEPHFNVRPAKNLNTGDVPGTHGHYNF